MVDSLFEENFDDYSSGGTKFDTLKEQTTKKKKQNNGFCVFCGEWYFPKTNHCPNCDNTDEMVDEEKEKMKNTEEETKNPLKINLDLTDEENRSC